MNRRLSGFCTFWLLLLSAVAAVAETVTLPLTLDHRLLGGLVQHAAFGGSGRSVALVGKPGDCIFLGLAEPRFSSAADLLRLEVKLTVRVGSPVGESCLVPVEWQGYLELFQRPVLAADTFQLSLQTVDSGLLTLERQPATIAGILWEFARPRVIAHLDRVRIDLAPPVAELGNFFAPLFHDQSPEKIFASLRGGAAVVTDEAVVVDLHAEVEEVYTPPVGGHPPLSEAERTRLVELWETWDSFLVHLLLVMAGESLSQEDRDILLDVLLEARYLFVETLTAGDLDRDFVREQFVEAWPRLAPIFRRQLYGGTSPNSLGFLAFFTAADALAVFDRMGPAFGVEISRNGLLRLAAMLDGKETTLPYSAEVDQRLREMLQLPKERVERPERPATGIRPGAFVPRQEKRAVLHQIAEIIDFFVSPAHGAEIPSFAEILRWKVPEKDIDGYLQRVRAVLAAATALTLERGEIPPALRPVFTEMILAMAWQESCFRQFVVKNKTLTYLLSSNHTSVGLMQINERVWRGVYSRERLRWDIDYNALAGTEIAELYLQRYALRGTPAKGVADPSLLARSVYAMYNGGPGQYQKFLERERLGQLYRSDLLFAEKLQWVQSAAWQELSGCFPRS